MKSQRQFNLSLVLNGFDDGKVEFAGDEESTVFVTAQV
jgi:hypothetical protein